MKKKYTNAEKVGIVKEGAKHGVKATLEKYGLSPATYYYWNKKYESMGEGIDRLVYAVDVLMDNFKQFSSC